MSGYLACFMRKLVILSVFICVVGGLVFIPIDKVVQVTDVKGYKPILYIFVPDGGEFIIKFIHSVNKRPVYDYVGVDQEQLVVKKSCFDAFGAGMPETTGSNGRLVMRDDGKLEFTDINRKQNEILLFSGTVSEHHILFNNHDVGVKELIAPGQPIRISVERISLWNKFIGRCLYE